VSPSRPSSAPPSSSDLEKEIRRKSLDAKTAAKVSNERGRRGIDNASPQVDNEDNNPPFNEAKVGEGRSEDVSDLIFVVHGIGQGVRAWSLIRSAN
jgi:hypothetical protein